VCVARKQGVTVHQRVLVNSSWGEKGRTARDNTNCSGERGRKKRDNCRNQAWKEVIAWEKSKEKGSKNFPPGRRKGGKGRSLSCE